MQGWYDRWRTAEHDPGRGNGKPAKALVLRCDCGWQGDFTHAVGHYRQTGHRASYQGIPQDFSRFAVTAEELEVRR